MAGHLGLHANTVEEGGAPLREAAVTGSWREREATCRPGGWGLWLTGMLRGSGLEQLQRGCRSTPALKHRPLFLPLPPCTAEALWHHGLALCGRGQRQLRRTPF